jgi:hypothetical protein
MTRLPVCALLGVVVAAVLAAGCGSDGGATTAQPTASATTQTHSESVASGNGRRRSKVELSKCRTKIGGDVWVGGLACKRAQGLEGALADSKLFGNWGQTRVYRSNDPQAVGWTCYAQLRPHALIQHVCWQRDHVLLFKFYG